MLFENYNPFSKKFLKFNSSNELDIKQFVKNSAGDGEDDRTIVGHQNSEDFGYFGANQSNISFNQWFLDKQTRLSKYREMAGYTEIGLSLDMVLDEAVSKNSKGDSFQFEITKTNDIKKSDIRSVNKEFDFVVKTLFNFEEMGHDLFYKFLVDGELYLEVVMDKKGKNIIGLKPLSAFNMVPIFVGGVLAEFAQIDLNTNNKDEVKRFPPEQILYVSYGRYGANKQDVRGYLDSSIRVYNQLRNLEDAVVIYRLVRAPERRVWNIETGNAPAGKAEELVKKVMNNYKRNLNYSSETGLINSSQNIQALTEDFWFARKEGQGSSVDVLQGGQQLGELEDINYFLRKLYKTLKIPPTRWGEPLGQQGTQYTNTKDIEREELNFTKFVERLQNKFVRIIEECFIMQLKVKGYDPKLLDRKRYRITMLMNNHFRQFREMELMREKLDMINNYQDLILSQDNPDAKISNEFFMSYIVNLPGNLAQKNNELLAIEKQAIEDEGGFEDPEDEETNDNSVTDT